MNWVLLGISIALEVAATIALKQANGFERMGLVALSITLYIVCFFFLVQVLKNLPVGVVYAIWSGVGTASVAVIAMIWLNEEMTVIKGICIGMIVTGTVGLHMITKQG